MKVSLKLNGSQFKAFMMVINRISFDRAAIEAAEKNALEEILWNLYVKIGRRLPGVKPEGNRITLSASEIWAITKGFQNMPELGLYEQNLITYLTGFIHQKLI